MLQYDAWCLQRQTAIYTGIIDKEMLVLVSLCIIFRIWLRIYHTDKYLMLSVV